MDTWDPVPVGGTVGLSQDVSPVPNGTMVQDGEGLSPCWWYNGIIPDVPLIPNGTLMVWDGHFGLKPLDGAIGTIPYVPNGTLGWVRTFSGIVGQL